MCSTPPPNWRFATKPAPRRMPKSLLLQPPQCACAFSYLPPASKFFRRHRQTGHLQVHASQIIPAGEIERFPIRPAERHVGGVGAAMDDAPELLAGLVQNVEPTRTARIDV